jgi:hypothetical protein
MAMKTLLALLLTTLGLSGAGLTPAFLSSINNPAVAGGPSGSPAVQMSGNTNWTSGTLSICTNSITCAGSDRLLVVVYSIGDSDLANSVVTSMTLGGTSLTKAWGTNDTASTWVRNELWYLVAPPTGAQNLIVSYFNTGIDQGFIGWVNLTNVNQSTPLGTVVTASGSSTTPSVSVSSATGDLVISSVASDSDANITASTGAIVQVVNVLGGDTCHGIATNAGAASVTMSWSTQNQLWTIGGVSIKKP